MARGNVEGRIRQQWPLCTPQGFDPRYYEAQAGRKAPGPVDHRTRPPRQKRARARCCGRHAYTPTLRNHGRVRQSAPRPHSINGGRPLSPKPKALVRRGPYRPYTSPACTLHDRRKYRDWRSGGYAHFCGDAGSRNGHSRAGDECCEARRPIVPGWQCICELAPHRYRCSGDPDDYMARAWRPANQSPGPIRLRQQPHPQPHPS